VTYCVGALTSEGLVMLADTRTNAGIDHISTFRKLHIWNNPGERTVAMLSSGNLAVTQAIVGLLNERIEDPNWDPAYTVRGASSMYSVARVVGDAIREVRRIDGPSLAQGALGFQASFLLGGQIAGRNLRLFHLYAEGNFIEATEDTPFFQIGETKYGRPILDRVMNFQMPMEEATKIALISMDSTLRSNMSVGLPLDLFAYRRDQAGTYAERRINETDQDYVNIRDGWGFALRSACQNINDITMSWC